MWLDLRVMYVSLNDQKFRLKIYDTNSTSKFKKILKSYIKNMKIIFVIFDVTSR